MATLYRLLLALTTEDAPAPSPPPPVAAPVNLGAGRGDEPVGEYDHLFEAYLRQAKQLAAMRASMDLAEREEAAARVAEAVAAVEAAEPVEEEPAAKPSTPAKLARRFTTWARRAPRRPVVVPETQVAALAQLLAAAAAVQREAGLALARAEAERDDEEAMLLLF